MTTGEAAWIRTSLRSKHSNSSPRLRLSSEEPARNMNSLNAPSERSRRSLRRRRLTCGDLLEIALLILFATGGIMLAVILSLPE